MYLIIHKIGERQIPIKLYENAKQAYNFIKEYISESSKSWCKVHLFINENNNKSIAKQRWYTYHENGVREEIGIRYMKLIRKGD